MIRIPEDHNELIQKFVDSCHAAQDSLNANDRAGAADNYKQMLAVYNDIAASRLEPLHKELAYDQLLKVYQALQQPQRASSIHATTHIIAAAVLLVLFSFLVFFKPAIFGFTTVDVRVVQELNWAFIESGSRGVHLDSAPKSLTVSGKIDGEGFVRVYATTPHERVLLLDNDLIRIRPDGTFSGACVTTCGNGLDSKDLALDVVIENAAVTIYSLEYLQ